MSLVTLQIITYFFSFFIHFFYHMNWHMFSIYQNIINLSIPNLIISGWIVSNIKLPLGWKIIFFNLIILYYTININFNCPRIISDCYFYFLQNREIKSTFKIIIFTSLSKNQFIIMIDHKGPSSTLWKSKYCTFLLFRFF